MLPRPHARPAWRWWSRPRMLLAVPAGWTPFKVTEPSTVAAMGGLRRRPRGKAPLCCDMVCRAPLGGGRAPSKSELKNVSLPSCRRLTLGRLDSVPGRRGGWTTLSALGQ